MKTYSVQRAATIDGTAYAAGDLITADQLRSGVLSSCVRTKLLREVDAVAAASDADVVPAGETLVEDPSDAGDAAGPDQPTQPDELTGFADERFDASIDTLDGVEPAALEALKAAELLCIGDLVEHLKEHGTLAGIATGIGKGRAEQITKALAPYLPAAA